MHRAVRTRSQGTRTLRRGSAQCRRDRPPRQGRDRRHAGRAQHLAVAARRALVIVPGDRHEILLSVCLAAMNGTRFAGLLLALGSNPTPASGSCAGRPRRTGLPILVTGKNGCETAITVHDLDPEAPSGRWGARWSGDERGRRRPRLRLVGHPADPEPCASADPPAFRRRLATRARQADRRIVLPEGSEPRTIRAATICQDMGSGRCVLLGRPDEVAGLADGLGSPCPRG